MNKHLFKLCFVAALLITASAAFAGGTGTKLSSSSVIGGGTFSPSNKVDIVARSTTTAYSAQSKHTSGNRQMGTNNLDPKMYWSALDVGSACGTPGSESVDYSGWTSL